jgi:uroporphyrin-III C-methyltransferase
LQLAGNVKAALIALETADSRLARMDRPQLTGLRRVISQDIERLKSAPHVDVIGMALRIDNLIVAVDSLPLAIEERVTAEAPASAAEQSGFWAGLWRETLQDLRELVRIQNTAKPEVPLVSPDQAFFLRENLKLRLLGARLALLAHDEVSFKSDLNAASSWLARYFDAGNKAVAAAQATIGQLAKSEVSIELPDISASLDAARNFKLVRERALR